MEYSEDILTLRIVDLVNKYPTSVRLRNCVNKAHELNKLPIETIGDYLGEILTAKNNLMGIENLGSKTADELIKLIESAIDGSLPPDLAEISPEQNLIVVEYPEQIRETKITDLVNSYATSVRLRNSIDAAYKANKLPFQTIGDYLDAGPTAETKLLKIDNLGKKTAGELIHLIDTIKKDYLPQESKHKRRPDLLETLSEQYPGVFDPLIEEYLSTPEDEVLKLEKLEKILTDLCDKKSKHAEMAWFRFTGETLEEIGKSYGLTRERVRQITSKYQEYMSNTDSAIWAEKSVRHLIAKNNDGNKLPSNAQLNAYHPKLAESLVNNFSLRKRGQLNEKRRLEVAQSLGLDTYDQLITQRKWTLEKLIYEVRKFAEELGKPDLMPMQVELSEQGRNDLRAIIQRFGGQSKVAELAGLIYQGQTVGSDGTRTYWTAQRIKELLHEVAEKEGHPGVMPTQAEVRRHAPNPDTITTILTRATYTNQPTRSWFDLAQEYGLQYEKGIHRVTRSSLINSRATLPTWHDAKN